MTTDQDTPEVPSLKDLDVGLTEFEPHSTDTWIPGYETVMDFFDHPTVYLEEEFGEDAIDAALFDYGLYHDAVARSVLDISAGRIEEALSHSYKGDLDLRAKISYQGLGGKMHDGIYARVRVDDELATALQFYIFGGRDAGARLADLRDGKAPDHYADFAAWLRHRYSSRPGFLPYESTEIIDWAEGTRGFTDYRSDRRGHKLGTVFEFVMTHYENRYGEEWDAEDLYYAVHDRDAPNPAEFYKGDLPQ